MNAVMILTLLSLMRPTAPQTFSPDPEGFIRNWLVLAPIAIEGESGASEIDKELFTLRIRKAMGQLDRPLQIRGLRRDLARVKTVLRQKADAR